MDPIESVYHLKKYRRKWKQKVRGFADQLFRTQKGVVDQDAMSMVREAEDAIAEANSNLVIYGYYTSVIILMDSDRKQLQENATEIRRIVQNMGFSARIETINNVEAFLGSLPGHAVENLRRPMISTMTLADFLPLASIWTGHEFCPCPAYPPSSPALLHAATEGATPFRLNLHVGDLGHTLIFGPTGAGKSTLLALIIAQFRRYKNATIFAFDKGNSLYALTHACGGTHYEIAGDSNNSPSFCPLADIQSQQDQAWAEGWIEIMLELQSIQVTPKQRNEIHRAMNLLLNSDVRTLTDFGTNLQDEGLRQALETYTISGATGYLLDSADDDLQFGSYQVFEIEHLMNLGEKTLIPVLLYIFHCIEKRLKGQPALLVLDEAWLMLGHPVFREKIREWLKVLRKSNCAVVLATQSLSDAVRSGILDVLQESCPTKILLPNEEAFNRGSGDVLGPRDLYEIIGLNEKQIEIIAGATKKRQYYYVSPEGRRLFELDLGPVALSFVGASGKQDLSIIRKLKDCFKEEWPWHWLRKRGVDFEKYF
jgi:type IV secretion/conjugal transfer VirB4 family ATPase